MKNEKMKYCMECGTKLEEKYLKDEGMIPYCPHCQAYRFPVYSTAVSMIVMNQQRNRILLIKQYHRPDYILVAGYINMGESAEQAVIREIKEETGLNVIEVIFNKSGYFEKSQTLMLNFQVIVDSEEFYLKQEEVDEATWFSIEEARKNIKSCSLAQSFLKHCLEKMKA